MPYPMLAVTAAVLLVSFALCGLCLAGDGSITLPTGLGDVNTTAVAAHDNLVVVSGTQDDGASSQFGYACVFQRESSGSFTHKATLRADDAAAGSMFGHAVAVTYDLVVVSATGDGSFQGAVYVFENHAGTWSQAAKLSASTGEALDFFGGSVACTEDRIVVGAWGDDESGAVSGAAYVFDRDGDDWVESAKLTASDASAGDAFGKSVSTQGDTIAVGAPDRGKHSGAAYVFRHSEGAWDQEAILTSGSAGDFCGTSVAIGDDVVAVGAPSADTPLKDSGCVVVFTKSESEWGEFQKLTSKQASGDRLGQAVSLSDGRLAASAPAPRSRGTGKTSIVVWEQGSTGSAWVETRRTVPDDPGGASSVGLTNAELVANPANASSSVQTFDLN